MAALRFRRKESSLKTERCTGSHTLKKVLFISYYFPPIGGGGIHRSLNFVKNLPDFGYFSTVLTCSSPTEERWAPKDYTLERQIKDNCTVFRVEAPQPPPETKGIRRLKNLFFLQDNFSKWWIKYAKELGEKIINENEIDLIFATMSPFQSSFVADYLSKKYNIPWVADLRDPWALDEMLLYPSFLHRKYDLHRMKTVLSDASAIVMNTPEAAKVLNNNYRKNKNKHILSITNGYDRDNFNLNVKADNIGKFRIVHSGTLFSESGIRLNKKRLLYHVLGGANKNVNIMGRSIVYLLKSIEKWLEEYPELIDKIEVVLIGNLTPDDIAMLEGSSCKQIFVLTGYISHKESINYLFSANLLFLPMHGMARGCRATTVPGKIFEYMATGRPILAGVPEGDARDILMKSGLAYISPPDDTKSMLIGLKSIYCDWENNVNSYKPNWDYISTFDRKNLAKKLAEIFDEIVK